VEKGGIPPMPEDSVKKKEVKEKNRDSGQKNKKKEVGQRKSRLLEKGGNTS